MEYHQLVCIARPLRVVFGPKRNWLTHTFSFSSPPLSSSSPLLLHFLASLFFFLSSTLASNLGCSAISIIRFPFFSFFDITEKKKGNIHNSIPFGPLQICYNLHNSISAIFFPLRKHRERESTEREREPLQFLPLPLLQFFFNTPYPSIDPLSTLSPFV